VTGGTAAAAQSWLGIGAGRPASCNAILASIAAGSFTDFAPFLEEASLPEHSVLFRSLAPTAHVYFPATAVVSLTSRLADGREAEMATAGREGLAGLHVFLETELASLDAVVQIGGSIWRAPIKPFQEYVAASPTFRRLLLRYAQAFFTDAAHTATCNALHRVSQRCARWLLATRDRVGTDRVHLSSQSLALTLGVHREGVTVALRALQDEGIIRGHRAYLDVVDVEGLTQYACSCYGVTRARFARLSGAPS
jgi:CRP-like cAMP-binding protein